MNSINDFSLDLKNYFTKMSRFYEGDGLNVRNAAGMSKDVKELKDLFDSYYKKMLAATSKHNFVSHHLDACTA